MCIFNGKKWESWLSINYLHNLEHLKTRSKMWRAPGYHITRKCQVYSKPKRINLFYFSWFYSFLEANVESKSTGNKSIATRTIMEGKKSSGLSSVFRQCSISHFQKSDSSESCQQLSHSSFQIFVLTTTPTEWGMGWHKSCLQTLLLSSHALKARWPLYWSRNVSFQFFCQC